MPGDRGSAAGAPLGEGAPSGPAFRAVTRRRAVDSGKAEARRKKALASSQNFGKDHDCQILSFPGFAGHRPAFHGGFCVSRLRESPQPAPCRRNYRSVVICADSSSRKTAGIIVLWAVRKPIFRIRAPRHAQRARSSSSTTCGILPESSVRWPWKGLPFFVAFNIFLWSGLRGRNCRDRRAQSAVSGSSISTRCSAAAPWS
jgi:hypothetical protein